MIPAVARVARAPRAGPASLCEGGILLRRPQAAALPVAEAGESPCGTSSSESTRELRCREPQRGQGQAAVARNRCDGVVVSKEHDEPNSPWGAPPKHERSGWQPPPRLACLSPRTRPYPGCCVHWRPPTHESKPRNTGWPRHSAAVRTVCHLFTYSQRDKRQRSVNALIKCAQYLHLQCLSQVGKHGHTLWFELEGLPEQLLGSRQGFHVTGLHVRNPCCASSVFAVGNARLGK